MKAKFYLLISPLIILSIALSACSGSASATPAVTNTPIDPALALDFQASLQEGTGTPEPTSTIESTETKIPTASPFVIQQVSQTPTNTATGVPVSPSPLATYRTIGAEVTPVPAIGCPYVKTGSSQPEKVAIEIKGEDGSKLYAIDLSKLPDCAIVFEGRFPWQTSYGPLATALAQSQIKATDGSPWPAFAVHMILDVRSGLGTFNPRPFNELAKDIIPDEYMDYLVYYEGSLWMYDSSWNISDNKPVKPSIAEEFEVKKARDAMKPGNYLFPRVIMQPTGNMFVYYDKDSGDTAYANGTVGCTKTTQPENVPVYGLWNGEQYSAAIGAGKCWMAVWVDGSLSALVWNGIQKDGDQIIKYQSVVEAVIFPSDWNKAKVDKWVASHK